MLTVCYNELSNCFSDVEYAVIFKQLTYYSLVQRPKLNTQVWSIATCRGGVHIVSMHTIIFFSNTETILPDHIVQFINEQRLGKTAGKLSHGTRARRVMKLKQA